MNSPTQIAGADPSAPDLCSGDVPYADTIEKITDPAALPPIEVDPVRLNLQRQSLLARMFGTQRGPDHLGRYELREELGRGGMGIVYKAHDPKLNRHVALKLITNDDPRMRERFRREAQAIAKVKHANVVDIYDTDADENDRPFITMEYVDGQTLSDWLHESPRDTYDIFKVFAAAGRGLAVVHDHGIVHHDFKPENVLIAKDGRVLVADFGLARASLASDRDVSTTEPHDDSDAFKISITQTGALLGTLHYMAPELLDRSRGDVRTDQFAFCVSLYEALTGERFFQLHGKSKREVYEEILRCEAKPLPRAIKVPRRVEAAILKGLSVRPADRHASMTELTELLRRVSKRPERRRGIRWAAISLVAMLALVGAFVVASTIIARSSDIMELSDEPSEALAVAEPPSEPELPERASMVIPTAPQPTQQPEQPAPPPPAVADAAPELEPKKRRKKADTVEFKLHAGDFDAANFDFGRRGERTVSTLKTIELPATKMTVKCREYDANKPREWIERTLDLRTDKRTITCLKATGPSLR